MTQQGTRYEGTTTQVDLDYWMTYAPTLVKYLGLTEKKDIDDLNSIGHRVRDDAQRLHFSLVNGDRKTKIIVTYSLKPNANTIDLHYCQDIVFLV